MALLDYEILRAICWTLVHSLWQGVVIAFLAGMVISLTKKSSSILRYRLLTLITLVFVGGVFVTFMREWSAASDFQSGVNPATSVSFLGESHNGLNDAFHLGKPNFKADVIHFLDKNAAFIVVLWLMVFGVKFLRLLTGLKEIHRMRNYQATAPDAFWSKRFDELQHLMKIPGKVHLLESALATVPAVTGFFKPVILVPIGMLNNLTQEQAEAILLHELAHVYRRDYFYNLLQGFIDMLFFFNPGVLWVSSLIRDERENCCDDMAIAVTQNKSEFVHALVSFQEYHRNRTTLALQFGAKKNHLLNRAQRILLSNNKPLSLVEKSILSFCLFVTLILCFAFSGSLQSGTQLKKAEASLSASLVSKVDEVPYSDRWYNPEEIPEGASLKFTDMVNGYSQPTYLFKIQDTLYQISGDIRIFKVNGREIPQEKMKPYLPVIRTLLSEHRQQERRLTQYISAADPVKRMKRILDDEKQVANQPSTTTTTTCKTTTTTTMTAEVKVDSGLFLRVTNPQNMVTVAEKPETCTPPVVSHAKPANQPVNQRIEATTGTGGSKKNGSVVILRAGVASVCIQ